MPTLEEALAAATVDDASGTEYCVVNDDTRVVTVPEKYKILGVESDEKAKRIWFRFPKIVGNNGVDLSAIGVRINFRNANGDGDIYCVEDLTVDGDYVIFSWELTRKVTAYKGTIDFVVCAVKSATDGTIKNEWNTTLNKDCKVLEGLEVKEQIVQENPDIIEYILANLGGSISAEQIATAVEEYMTANPVTAEGIGAQKADFIVQITEVENGAATTYAADKTHAEIKEAYESGRNCYACVSGDKIPLMYIDTLSASFENSACQDTFGTVPYTSLTTLRVIIYDDDRKISIGYITPKQSNPYKLTFDGAVTTEYDGSGAVTVTIPDSTVERIEKGSTDTTAELQPNKLYVFPEIASLTLTFAAPTDTSIANEYHIIFTSGATATTLTIPDTIKIPDGFTIEANKIYELSVLENCLTYQSWEVTA